MNLQEAFDKPLPFRYAGSEPWEGITGKGTHHYHEFEHDGNTYRVQHTVFEPNPWGDVHASVAFKVKEKNSNRFTDELTPSSAPTKVFGTIGEITKRMKEKHGITSLTASGVSGKTDKRNKLYQKVIQKISGKPTELDSDLGVVRVGLGEMLKASVAARAKELFESIVKRGDEYVVMNSKKTKVLGKHKSKKKANAQLAAIEISKKERMNEEIEVKPLYRSEFTNRIRSAVKRAKAGEKNPALDPNNPKDRSGAARALTLARDSDQLEVRSALKAIEGGADDLTSYIQTGNPHPGFLSRTDVSGMRGREELVKKLVSYKGKI